MYSSSVAMEEESLERGTYGVGKLVSDFAGKSRVHVRIVFNHLCNAEFCGSVPILSKQG